jgi:MoxR-like ATPase
VLLADEINRTPPKTQAALLEAMQEGQVTIEGESRELPDPFLVVGTQNPIEYEGTYPLPEAQLDRFLFKVDIGYPDEEVETAIVALPHRGVAPATLEDVEAVVSVGDIAAARDAVDAITVSDEVVTYVTRVVRETRSLPALEIVAGVAPATLRHRLVLNPDAELERYRPDDAVQAALAAVPVPR